MYIFLQFEKNVFTTQAWNNLFYKLRQVNNSFKFRECFKIVFELFPVVCGAEVNLKLRILY